MQASQSEFEAMVRNVDVKSKIMDQYVNWKGVRYRLGGETKRGIDCSAFVQRTFREQFGMELPRSIYGQADVGKKIHAPNCVQAIWYCPAPVLLGTTSASIWVMISLCMPQAVTA